MSKSDRGFASMDPAKQRAIASKGGKMAHAMGSAHQWDSEQARAAGRKGGQASHRIKAQRKAAEETPATPAAIEAAE